MVNLAMCQNHLGNGGKKKDLKKLKKIKKIQLLCHKKKVVMVISVRCWNENFSSGVTCNMCCWIDWNGTVPAGLPIYLKYVIIYIFFLIKTNFFLFSFTLFMFVVTVSHVLFPLSTTMTTMVTTWRQHHQQQHRQQGWWGMGWGIRDTRSGLRHRRVSRPRYIFLYFILDHYTNFFT